MSKVNGVVSKGTACRLSINVSERATGVRGEEMYEVSWGEARVTHTREDLVHIVLGLGDETRSGGDSRVRAACEELETRSTWAV